MGGADLRELSREAWAGTPRPGGAASLRPAQQHPIPQKQIRGDQLLQAGRKQPGHTQGEAVPAEGPRLPELLSWWQLGLGWLTPSRGGPQDGARKASPEVCAEGRPQLLPGNAWGPQGPSRSHSRVLPLSAHREAGVLGASPLFTCLVALDQPHQGRGSPVPSRAVVQTGAITG